MKNNIEPTEKDYRKAQEIISSCQGMEIQPPIKGCKTLSWELAKSLAEQRGLSEKENQYWQAKLTTTSIALGIEKSMRITYEKDFHTLKDKIQGLVKAGDSLARAYNRHESWLNVDASLSSAWDKAKGEK